MTHLLQARDAGQLNDLELNETLVNMFFGGVETTRNQLGLALDLFLQQPDQWELLAREPGAGAGRCRRGDEAQTHDDLGDT